MKSESLESLKKLVVSATGLQHTGILEVVRNLSTFDNLNLMESIHNSRVTKRSYKTELHILMSQTELLTLKLFFFFLIFRVSNFNIILALVTRDF